MQSLVAAAEQRLDDNALKAMERYESRMYEITSNRWVIFDRRKCYRKSKYYGIFMKFIIWCEADGTDFDDFLTLVLPHKPKRFGPNWINTESARSKYHEIRTNHPSGTVHQINQVEMDTVQSNMKASIEIFRQNYEILNNDYARTLTMSGPSLSPEFLATDIKFVELLNRQLVRGPYCIAVMRVFDKMVADPQYQHTLMRMRDAALSCA